MTITNSQSNAPLKKNSFLLKEVPASQKLFNETLHLVGESRFSRIFSDSIHNTAEPYSIHLISSANSLLYIEYDIFKIKGQYYISPFDGNDGVNSLYSKVSVNFYNAIKETYTYNEKN